MKNKKSKLNKKEREILRVLHKEGGRMTRHEITKKTGIAYVTVGKYADKMIKEGILIEEQNDKKQEQKIKH